MSSTPLTILQLLEKNQFNTGSVHQMFQAAEGLRERGHAVTIVSREGSELRGRAGDAGIDFVALPLRGELDLRSICGLQRIVREKRPDVIHVHKGLSHTLALAATWRQPVGAFVVNRGVSFPLTIWNRGKYRTRRVDRVVTVCEQIRQVIIRSGKIDPGRVEVIYAGVDVSLFDPARWSRSEFRDEKSIPRDAFHFIQVGVRDWKGWRELIDAFSDLPRSRPLHLTLVACNSVEQKRVVASHAEARGVGASVTPVEYRSDMARVLASADCVVDASWDGTGITGTIREAMALGKAVIATDCGGNRELVSSPRVGWLVGPKQRAALAAAMTEVITDDARRCATGLAARAHVTDGFSKDRRIERLETLYRGILEAKQRG
jgi:glycosyltransferase involved in cell wall biosynthesis